MLVLATAAAVIASQALISGAFSLTHQAMQLGYSPRLTVTHTSKHEAGQIYIPQVNRALMVGCIALVLFFRSSSALASAYGIAVTGTMVITTILFTQIARRHWGWSRFKAFAFLAVFLTIDWRVPRRERDQDRVGRLVPARGRARRLRDDDHVESRTPRAAYASARRQSANRTLSR